jgi:hypothetical protein
LSPPIRRIGALLITNRISHLLCGAIVIYVNKNSSAKPILPDDFEGIPVTVILTDEFIAR